MSRWGPWLTQAQAGVGVDRVSMLPTAIQRLGPRQAHHSPKLLIRKKLSVQLRGWLGHLGLGTGGGSWKSVPCTSDAPNSISCSQQQQQQQQPWGWAFHQDTRARSPQTLTEYSLGQGQQALGLRSEVANVSV